MKITYKEGKSARGLSGPVSNRLLALVALLAAIILPKSIQAQSSPELELQAAPIAYPNPALAPQTVLDFYYLISQSGLEFLHDSASGMDLGNVFAQVTLFDSLSSPIDSTQQAFRVRKSINPNSESKIANVLTMAISPGEYTAQLYVLDVVSKRKASYFFPLVVRAPDTTGLAVSDVHLGHSLQIIESKELASRDPLARNGRRLTPNPTGVYSTLNPNISLYAEVYNLQADTDGMTKMGVRVELQKISAEFPQILDDQYFEASGSSLVYSQTLPHGVSTPGRALLRLIVTDAVSGVTDTSRRILGFFTPGAEPPAPVADTTGGSVELAYDTTSLETREHIVYWLLTPRQRDLMESLTSEGKQQFLEQFWRDNDPDIRTKRNEYREGAMERFFFANQRYSSSVEKEDGWKSDPGRVLMQYGMPDEIIEVALPTIENDITDVDPWERWNYNSIQGGVYFIFSNEQGYSNYYIKHSNAQGERFDRGVEERINQVFRTSGG